MIINGIESFVAIFIDDANDGSPIEEYYFKTFDEFNQFIRENKNNSKYDNVTFSYTFVEAIDGEPGYCSWTDDLILEEWSPEDIVKKIEEYISWKAEFDEEFKEIDDWSKQLHYMGECDDYLSKREHLKDISYVCPNCLREVDDCRCAQYSYYLVQIDTLILPIIRLLNEKGYKTTGCCAGHPNAERDAFIQGGIYVCFDQDYDFIDDLPEGAQYSKLKHCIMFVPQGAEIDDLLLYQRQVLDDLMEWTELLDDYE